MTPTRRSLAHVQEWLRDRSLTILVVMLGLLIFVVTPLADMEHISRPHFGSSIAIVLVAGIFAAARSRIAAAISLTLGIVLVPLQLAQYAYPHHGLHTAFLMVAVLFVIFLCYTIMKQVFAPGAINKHRILGAIALYLLIAVFFSLLYQLLLFHSPDAFAYETRAAESPVLAARTLYFSFITLTSTGYGDITPVAPVARSLAILEAITGQLFPAILLARLVSLGLSRQ